MNFFGCKNVDKIKKTAVSVSASLPSVDLTAFGKIFKINNQLKSLNIDFDYDIPTCVIVGSQSSGKSTVLNKLIGRKILPVGNSKMVTRTPVQIALHKSNDDKIIVSYFKDGNDVIFFEDKYSLCTDDSITSAIENVTDKICKKNDVSSDIVYITIKSNSVNNIILIDNIGLISSSRNDDLIEEKIYTINKNIISKNNIFILNIIKANNDIETDISYSFIKKHTKGKSNIHKMCIITKIDTLTSNLDDFNDTEYNCGYFAINNLNDTETYYKYKFSNTVFYKRNRLGMNNIKYEIEKQISKFMSSQMTDIKESLRKISKQIRDTYSRDVLTEKKKLIYIASLSNTFCILISQSIDSVGNISNIGMHLNSHISNMNREINNYNPMIDDLSDTELLEIIKSYEGLENQNKLNLIINHCISSREKRPIETLKSYIDNCFEQISIQITSFIDILIKKNSIDTYPVSTNKYIINEYPILCQFIKNEIHKNMNNYKNIASNIIYEQLKIQEQLNSHEIDYNIVYSYRKKDENRCENLADMTLHNTNNDIIMTSGNISYNITEYRNTIEKAFNKIKYYSLDIANKTIMSAYLNKMKYSLNSDLLESIKNENITELFNNSNYDEQKIINIKNIENMINDFIK